MKTYTNSSEIFLQTHPDRDYARDTHLMYLHKNSDDAKLNDVDTVI